MKLTITATQMEYNKLVDTLANIEAQLHGEDEGRKCAEDLCKGFTHNASDAGPCWKANYDATTGTIDLEVEDGLFIQAMEFINDISPICLPLIGGLKKLIAPIATRVKELFFKNFARFIPSKKYVVIKAENEKHEALAVVEDDGWGHIHPAHIFHIRGAYEGDDSTEVYELCKAAYVKIMADEFMNVDKILGKFDNMDEAVDIAHKRYENTMFVGTPS